MTSHIISDKTIKEELNNYFHALKMKKTSSIIYIVSTIIVLSLTLVTLIFIYIFPQEYVGIFNPNGRNQGSDNIWIFTTFLLITLFFGTAFLLYISFWYSKAHDKAQVHIPIIISSGHVIDICAVIVGVFDFIASVLAACAPLILGWHNEEYAWNADTKVVLYVIVTAFIFLFWAVFLPIFQKKIANKDNRYFRRYIYFEYEEVDKYIEHLKKMYKTRVRQFNNSLKFKDIDDEDKNKIIYTKVEKNEPFSWDTRRVFKGHVSKYGNEYDIVKYILFIEIFTIIFEYDRKNPKLKSKVNDFIRNATKRHSVSFNEKFNEYISRKNKSGIFND